MEANSSSVCFGMKLEVKNLTTLVNCFEETANNQVNKKKAAQGSGQAEVVCNHVNPSLSLNLFFV